MLNNFKMLLGIIFMVVVPFMIFLSPFAVAYNSGNYWYILLLFVTWFPALVIAKFAAEISKDLYHLK
jgi:hypothetical protein